MGLRLAHPTGRLRESGADRDDRKSLLRRAMKGRHGGGELRRRNVPQLVDEDGDRRVRGLRGPAHDHHRRLQVVLEIAAVSESRLRRQVQADLDVLGVSFRAFANPASAWSARSARCFAVRPGTDRAASRATAARASPAGIGPPVPRSASGGDRGRLRRPEAGRGARSSRRPGSPTPRSPGSPDARIPAAPPSACSWSVGREGIARTQPGHGRESRLVRRARGAGFPLPAHTGSVRGRARTRATLPELIEVDSIH